MVYLPNMHIFTANLYAMVVVSILLSFFPPLIAAQDTQASLEVAPAVVVPLGESADNFEFGFGGVLRGSLPVVGENLYGSGVVGYTGVPTVADTRLSLLSVGIGPGVGVPITDAVRFDLLTAGGAYFGIYEGESAANPYASAGARVSVSFSESFSLGAGASYEYYLTNNAGETASLFTGLSGFVGGRVTPGAVGAGTRRPRIEVQPPQFGRVFPVSYSYYDDNPLGGLVIRNTEAGPIEDVRVTTFVEQYMSSPTSTPAIDRMERGERLEVDLFALFRDSILSVTEPSSVQAMIRVEYLYRGQELAFEEAYTLRIQNRNQVTWDDDRKVAGFVTAGDPTVMRFSRNTTALIRGVGTTAVNEELRTAMGIFEALRLHGVEYVIDPDSSYIELSRNESALDHVQFPQQTLDFRAGDCDDLSILYSSLLESVGIETAFITTPGHIYLAFALEVTEEEARRTFAAEGDLIFRNGRVWVPVEITLVRDGFLRAWTAGGKQWREAVSNDVAGFYPVREAWQVYEPTAFASQPLELKFPGEAEVVPQYTARLDQFIDREIAPQVDRLRDRIAASGNSPRLVNRLGTLYARYGLYDEALGELLPLTRGSQPHVPSLVNAGNVYYLRDDLDTALGYYQQAYSRRQDDPTVLLSLARTHFDREEYAVAEERYRMAEVLAPAAAESFSYIVSETSAVGRAATAGGGAEIVWDEE